MKFTLIRSSKATKIFNTRLPSCGQHWTRSDTSVKRCGQHWTRSDTSVKRWKGKLPPCMRVCASVACTAAAADVCVAPIYRLSLWVASVIRSSYFYSLSEQRAGERLLSSSLHFESPTLKSLPEYLQASIRDLKLATSHASTEEHAQTLVSSICGVLASGSPAVQFFDTHQSGLPDGQKPGGFIGFSKSWSKCISVVEAKSDLSPTNLATAIGHVAKRFRRILIAVPERQRLVFFLFGSTEIRIGCMERNDDTDAAAGSDLTAPPIRLSISESLVLDETDLANCTGTLLLLVAQRASSDRISLKFIHQPSKLFGTSFLIPKIAATRRAKWQLDFATSSMYVACWLYSCVSE